MRHSLTIAILTIVFIVCQSTTFGQTSSDSSKIQKLSAATERARAGFLVGTFTTTSLIPPMPSIPKGVTGNGTSSVTWALDSMFLSIEEESYSTFMGHFKQHGMLGYDPQAHEFVLSMFNSTGDHPTYHGNFEGDTLVLQTKIQAPKASFDQKLQWFKDGDAVKLNVLNDFGSGFLLIYEQTSTPASQKMK